MRRDPEVCLTSGPATRAAAVDATQPDHPNVGNVWAIRGFAGGLADRTAHVSGRRPDIVRTAAPDRPRPPWPMIHRCAAGVVVRRLTRDSLANTPRTSACRHVPSLSSPG